MSTFVTMRHPSTGGTASVSDTSFTQTWQPLGWELVTPATVITTYGAAMRYRGAWSSTVRYSPGDVVDYTGALYVAILNSLSAAPAGVPTAWDEIVDTEVVVSADIDGGSP